MSNGIYLIDKPTGMTSFQVLREMRRILWLKKIGHTGTLDPLATGLLIVATGEYTKLIPLLEKTKKTYEATIRLDGVSPSYDSDTEIAFLSEEKQDHFHETLSQEKIQILLDCYFSGTISQTPPAYSALKIQGKTSLERIMAGETVTMTPREVEIFSHEILEFSYPEIRILFEVSAGTYIRSIAHDLGQRVGSGGYIAWLRRTGIEDISLSRAVSLEDISEASQISLPELFWDRCITLDDTELYARLEHGQRVRGDYDFSEHTSLLLYDGVFPRYIIEYKDGVIHPRKKII